MKNKQLKFKLSMDEFYLLLEALGDIPLKRSINLYSKLQYEAQTQLLPNKGKEKNLVQN
jgi:hypothetical protein